MEVYVLILCTYITCPLLDNMTTLLQKLFRKSLLQLDWEGMRVRKGKPSINYLR